MSPLWTYLSLLAFSLSASANPLLADRDVCNADNCLRAVRGATSRPSASAGVLDCSARVITKVPAVTVTVTQYATEPPRLRLRRDDQLEARQATQASALPAYASQACGGQATRYTSACSCAGVMPGTVTDGTTTVTVTGTLPVQTSTTTTAGAGACKRGKR